MRASLLCVVGNVYGRIIIDKLFTDKSVEDERWAFECGPICNEMIGREGRQKLCVAFELFDIKTSVR